MSESPFGRHIPEVLRAHHVDFRIGRALDVGCANGAVTHWLKGLGYAVTGIDVQLPEGLNPALFQQADIRAYPIERLDLIVALNVLQFLSTSEKRDVLMKFADGLSPKGHLVIESFTTEDEGYRSCRDHGLEEREPNTFWSPRRCGYVSFFSPGELQDWAGSAGLQTLSYKECLVNDDHLPLGPHTHALVTAVFQKP